MNLRAIAMFYVCALRWLNWQSNSRPNQSNAQQCQQQRSIWDRTAHIIVVIIIVGATNININQHGPELALAKNKEKRQSEREM